MDVYTIRWSDVWFKCFLNFFEQCISESTCGVGNVGQTCLSLHFYSNTTANRFLQWQLDYIFYYSLFELIKHTSWNISQNPNFKLHSQNLGLFAKSNNQLKSQTTHTTRKYMQHNTAVNTHYTKNAKHCALSRGKSMLTCIYRTQCQSFILPQHQASGLGKAPGLYLCHR